MKIKLKNLSKKTVCIIIAVTITLLAATAVLANQIIRVSVWDEFESVLNPGNLTNPQSIANALDVKPFRVAPTDASFTLPHDKMPEGFTVQLANISEPDIIKPNGNVAADDQFHYVSFQYEVTRLNGGRKAYSPTARVYVPGKIPLPDDSKNISIPYEPDELRYGVYFHMVAGDNVSKGGGGYVYANGKSPRGITEFCNAMDVDAIVKDVVDLGFDVVYITSNHGYMMPLYPSAVTDFWRGLDPKTGKSIYSPERDFLGELIQALKKHNIKVSVFTHPLDGHDISASQQLLLGWGTGDSMADAGDPKRQDVFGNAGRTRTSEEQAIINEITGNKFQKWNDFVNELYAEFMARYGNDIIALGFDSDWGNQPQEQIYADPAFNGNTARGTPTLKLDHERLRNTLKAYNPQLPMLSLASHNLVATHYFKELWRPHWFDGSPGINKDDFNVLNWPAYDRPVAIPLTQHWGPLSKQTENRVHLTGTQMFQYTVLQMGTATYGPTVLWSTTPYADGQWQAGTYEQMLTCKKMMDRVGESLFKTVPSTTFTADTRPDLGRPHVTINNVASGMVATRSANHTTEYIHVLRPPTSGKTITTPVPKDGKRFETGTTAGVLLPSGNQVSVTQNGNGSLTIDIGSNNWDKYDTVIKLKTITSTIPVKNLALYKPVVDFSSTVETKSSNATTGVYNSFGQNWVTNGQKDVGWSSNNSSTNNALGGRPTTTYPQWITVDLKKVESVSKVVLYPHLSSASAMAGFPNTFTIEVSTNGINWTNFATVSGYNTTTNPTVGREYTVATPMQARYIKINATAANYVAGTNPNYRIMLNEIEVYS